LRINPIWEPWNAIKKSAGLAREQFAQARRRQLLDRQNRLDLLQSAPARTQDEALAKFQALHLMEKARPWP